MTPTKMTADEEYATKAVVVQRVQYVHVEADKGIGTDRETAGVHVRAVARPVASFIGDTDVERRRHECVNPGIPQVLAHINELCHCEESICHKRQVRAMLPVAEQAPTRRNQAVDARAYSAFFCS